MRPTFLIVAPSYTHRSAGVRALYRLCHHLNAVGYRAAMTPVKGTIDRNSEWLTPVYEGPVGDSIVIYPEIVSGNPLKAERVVRWALNNPGLIGGDRHYADSEMVFVFNRDRAAIVSAAAGEALGPNRVLFVGLIDPAYIYPDPQVAKAFDCYFVSKGRPVRQQHRLHRERQMRRLEKITPSMASLGDVLRRTRTLFSYDHASNVLKEAVICGCRVLVMHDDGKLRDPQTCGCAHNIYWEKGFREGYAARFHDSSFVADFVQELGTRWAVPAPSAYPAIRRIGLEAGRWLRGVAHLSHRSVVEAPPQARSRQSA